MKKKDLNRLKKLFNDGYSDAATIHLIINTKSMWWFRYDNEFKELLYGYFQAFQNINKELLCSYSAKSSRICRPTFGHSTYFYNRVYHSEPDPELPF